MSDPPEPSHWEVPRLPGPTSSDAGLGHPVGMAFDVRPADTFEDVQQVIGPKRPGANVCWCLSYRPVDNRGARVDLTMGYVGTRALFERCGFDKAADTTSVLDGFPRVLMRRNLR